MAYEFKIYFDDILQKNEDISSILNNFSLNTIREDGFNGSDNILRELTKTTMSATGCTYSYLSQKFKSNPCADTKVYIEINLDGEVISFNGLFRQSSLEWYADMKIVKIKAIKDDSFSGLIQDFSNIDTFLFNKKTKNCFPLSLPQLFINTPPHSISGVYYSITDVSCFDVLDVIRFLVAFHTDNRVGVVSDYLTNNKYAITTGFNMHNVFGNIEKRFPNLSIDKMFSELRKKFVLNKSVEYDVDGKPYLRIEEEEFYYSNDELFQIPGIPLGIKSEIDLKRIYNSIDVGSSKTNLEDTDNIIISQINSTGWNKETVIGCGGCAGEKESNLNLVSDFIIDANLIHEAMLQPAPVDPTESDYANDDDIFMFNYSANPLDPTRVYFNFPSGYNAAGFTNDGYNKLINNINVLNRWVGVSNSCIATSRYMKYGFKAVNTGDNLLDKDYIIFTIGGPCTPVFPIVSYLGLYVELYDNENSVDSIIQPASNCTNYGYQTKFTCQEIGLYNFHSKSIIQANKDANLTDDVISADFEVRFVVFQDNTLTTIIDSSPITVINYPTTILVTPPTVSFEIDSPTFNLAIGNVVMVEISLVTISIQFGSRVYDFRFSESVFELLSDNTTCEDITDNQNNFKPYTTEFEYALCPAQYNIIKNNKRGYILLNGYKAWIGSVEYFLNKKSKLKLITKDLIC